MALTMHAADFLALPIGVAEIVFVVFGTSIAGKLTVLSRVVFQTPTVRWPWTRPLVNLVFENGRLGLMVRILGGIYVITALALAVTFRLLDR